MRLGLIVLSLLFSASQSLANICSRNPSIVKALEAATGKMCASMTPDVLASVVKLRACSVAHLGSRGLNRADLDGLSGLKDLDLSLCDLNENTLAKDAFTDLVALEKFSMGNNYFREFDFGILAPLGALRELDLGTLNYYMRPVYITQSSKALNFPLLKKLNVSFNNFGSGHSPADGFEQIPFAAMTALEDLDASRTFRSKLWWDFRNTIPASLKTLNLSFNHITRIYPGSFQMLSQLRSLDLSNNDLEHITLESFEGLPQLESLDLGLNSRLFMYSKLRGLFSLLSSLRYLVIENTHLKFFDVGDLTGLKNLEILVMRTNPLKKLDAGAFADLKSLRKIDLRNLRIKDAGPNIFDSTQKLDLIMLPDIYSQLEKDNFTQSFPSSEIYYEAYTTDFKIINSLLP